MVYGTTLCLPGEFLMPSPLPTFPGIFADLLHQQMVQLRAVPVAAHGQKAFYVSHGLQTATRVFVRHDARRTPLQHPYDGLSCSQPE